MFSKMSKDDSCLGNVYQNSGGDKPSDIQGRSSKGPSVQSGATGFTQNPVTNFQYTTGAGYNSGIGQYGRKYMADRPICQDRTGFMRRLRMGGIGPALSRPLNETPKKKKSEPESDEAFVEESGIKLFTPSAPSKTPQLEEIHDEDESEEEQEDEQEDEEEEDPLYELDVMDDTIVEEGEEDESENDSSDSDEDKSSNNNQSKTSTNQELPEKSLPVTTIAKNIPQPKLPPTVNQGPNLPVKQAIPIKEMQKSNSSSSSSSNSSEHSVHSIPENAQKKKPEPKLLSEIPSNKLSTQTKRDSGSSNSSRDSGMGESSTLITAGDLAVNNPPESFLRGRSGRMSLPLTRASKPHKFIIKKVSENDGPARRNANYIDSRFGEIRSPDQQGRGSGARTLPSPIWVRRQQETTVTTGKGHQTGTGEQLTDQHGHGRPRSGTWSMSNARRGKAEEEVQASRQRRKSGDDVLNASKEKEKKKETTPGFMEAFRPRSKSDAAQRGKKPNILTNMKNVFQHTLVSPSGGSTRGGRRSGEVTPVEPASNDDVYHTWHAGATPPHKTRQSDGARTPMRWWHDIFQPGKHRSETPEERVRRKSGGKHERGIIRRHSVEPDKKKHNSGNYYIRGEMDPNQVAEMFRDSRGLPATDTFLENVKRKDLEEDETKIFVKFFNYHQCYDLIPTSAKLVIFDTRLPAKKAFHALVYNGVRAAPLWDSKEQKFVGMLTITDFIRILQSFYHSPSKNMEELEDHRLDMWRTILKDEDRPLISITPDAKLYFAIRLLIHHKIHRLPVIEPVTGNALYIITHKRILKFLYLYITDLPKPSILQKTLGELNLGSYDNIQTATEDTLIIEALNQFVEYRVSALPIVDAQGKLVNIYAKFDVINLAAEGTYHNLDVTLRQANERRNEWFEGVQKCTLDETLSTIMERIVRAEVHRLVVIDSQDKVIGIISLSDILKELVLRPCHDHEPGSLSLLNATIGQMETKLKDGVTEDLTDTKTSSIDLTGSMDLQSEESNLDQSLGKMNISDDKESFEETNGVDSKSSEDGIDKNIKSDKQWNKNELDKSEEKCVNGAKASPVDSEDEGRYSISDADDAPPVNSGQIINIPG